MTQLIEAMIAKAEADSLEMQVRLAENPDGPDAHHLQTRLVFHNGQVSGLRHALFAIRTLDKERTNA